MENVLEIVDDFRLACKENPDKHVVETRLNELLLTLKIQRVNNQYSCGVNVTIADFKLTSFYIWAFKNDFGHCILPYMNYFDLLKETFKFDFEIPAPKPIAPAADKVNGLTGKKVEVIQAVMRDEDLKRTPARIILDYETIRYKHSVIEGKISQVVKVNDRAYPKEIDGLRILGLNLGYYKALSADLTFKCEKVCNDYSDFKE